MDSGENTLFESIVYDGKIIRVKKLKVRLPNGKQADREVVYHPGAVAVLAEPRPGTITLVRQYRKPIEGFLLELPAGKLEANEEPLACARRELREETGYLAVDLEEVCTFYTSPGFANETIHLFYAFSLTEGETSPDEDELVDVCLYSKSEVVSMLKNGEIRDAKTLIGLMWWCQRGDLS